MKITYKGDYALKAMLDLAVHYGELATIHEIAERIDAPIKFLEQVLLELKRGGFVESRRGKIGGYLLARSPEKILLGDVVRFVEGPIEPIACVKTGYQDCADSAKCVFRSIWQEVTSATASVIDNVTFGDLVLKANSTEQNYAYAI
jgi:Rrf2 family protein